MFLFNARNRWQERQDDPHAADLVPRLERLWAR